MNKKKHRLLHSPKLQLEITQELIERAVPKDSNHCMIAEAVRRAYPAARAISVDLATVRFTDPKKTLRFTYLTPRIVQAALINFDQERKPEPFSFVLRKAAQITISSGPRFRKARSEKLKAASPRKKAAIIKAERARLDHVHRLTTKLRSASLAPPTSLGAVPERLGGQTPPLQRSSDNVPFSRRRRFGLRALEL